MPLAHAPTVSVIIPTYNNARYIEQAIRSATDQDYPSIQTIVVDDGSTDGTPAALSRFGDGITVVRQPNKGAGAARNKGLDIAAGEYVAFLDADDWFLPGKCRKQVEILERRREWGAVHSGYLLADASGNIVETVERWHDVPILDLVSWVRWTPVLNPAMLYRRDALEKIGRFDPAFRQGEDVEYMLRLALSGCKMGWLREPTYCYRQHDDSTLHSKSAETAGCVVRVLDKFFATPNLPRRVRRLESFVRYYAALYASWCQFEVGGGVDVVAHLKRTRKHSRENRQQMVCRWFLNFVKWTVDSGGDALTVKNAFSAFQEAAEMDAATWQETTASLEWLVEVWRPYAEGDHVVGSAKVAAEQGLAARNIAMRLCNYIHASPHAPAVPAVARLWADARAAGIRSGLQPVASVYLTLAGRAMAEHGPATAGRVLLDACLPYRDSASRAA